MVDAVEVPSRSQLEALAEIGQQVGYNGVYIYLRYREILAALAGQAFESVLVVGCGYGLFDRLLPPSASLVGVDPAQAEVAFASEWAHSNRPSYRYLQSDLEALQLPADTFDLVIASEVLEHIAPEEADRLIQEVVRVAKPGATVVFTVPNLEQLRNRARRAVAMKPVFMDPTHLREYTKASLLAAVSDTPLREQSLSGAVLYFPLETKVSRILSPWASLRRWLAHRYPVISSHLILTARKAIG
jgi:SAM-dependent methyltransferase